MSKVMEAKINELFEATKDLQTFEELEPFCVDFNEFIATQKKSVGTLGKDFSRYGLYKKFNSLELEQGKNAILEPKHDENGNVKGNTLKHYVVSRVGLTPEQWHERNTTTRVLDRLDNGKEIEPVQYLEVAGKLLESLDSHELAVGLIAVTGRRPHEIIARAKFESIEGKPYHVMFSGQGKKRGKTPKFEIATLYPADYVIKALARLRKDESVKSLLAEVRKEFPASVTKQNIVIDNRRGNSLRRVVASSFGDKSESAIPVLPIRHQDTKDNCKALRAAYAVLATERDCQGGYGAKILHAASLLGHFTRENADDKSLMAIATTAGYSDYFCNQEVSFPVVKEAVMRRTKQALHAYSEDVEDIKKLQGSWKCANQAEVVTKLLQRRDKDLELGKLLQAKDAEVKVLKQELRELKESLKNQSSQVIEQSEPLKVEEKMQVNNHSIQLEDLAQMIALIVEAKLDEKLGKHKKKETLETETKPAPKPVEKEAKKSSVDFSELSNAELWANKKSGASEEKVKRSFLAVCTWNDYQASNNDERLAITNLLLRELSGCNGGLVGDWLRSHADEVISHNSKYGLQNSKDANKLETYANKRLKPEVVQELMGKIKGTLQ